MITGGQILQVATQNKWRLNWTPNSTRVPQNDAEIGVQAVLTLQAISIEMTSIPYGAKFGINDPGSLIIKVEHDITGEVGKAIEFLKSADTLTTISVEILDGDNKVRQTIVYTDVQINNQQFILDYASSETFKSVLTCTFGSMEVF